MADRDFTPIPAALSDPEREALVLRYWRRGDLTPLAVANSLARTRAIDAREAMPPR